MDINKMIEKLKEHNDSSKIGMIATHLGIVRGTSRKGGEVQGIEVKFDLDCIKEIKKDIKALDGIVDVSVDINEGRLKIGDEIMAVAVAGDIRENVFPALVRAVNRIKEEASRKKEFFIKEGE